MVGSRNSTERRTVIIIIVIIVRATPFQVPVRNIHVPTYYNIILYVYMSPVMCACYTVTVMITIKNLLLIDYVGVVVNVTVARL